MIKYKNYQLIYPNGRQIAQITKLIERKNGSIFHDVALNKIVGVTFKTQLYYFVNNPSEITSCSPIHIIKNKFGLKRYNFKPLYDIPYAGFVGSDGINIKEIKVGPFESIKYESFPYDKQINDNIKNIRLGETAMVDLSLTEDEIFSNEIHSKRRNMIRKAINSGIEIKMYADNTGLKLFWPILKQLHDKLGYDHLTFDYYNKILEYYGARNQAHIILAFKGEMAISGILIIGNKNYMHYYKGASFFGIKNEGQGELLQWEAIKLSKALGTKFYDLCNLNKEKLPAIYKFKTGISSNIFQYEIFTNNNFGYKLLNSFL